MKKLLLSAFVLLGTVYNVKGQVFQADNFNSYTVGNLGTDITGEVSGQGNWLTFTSGTGGANTDFQIVTEPGENANILQITGSSTTENKFAWKNVAEDAWDTREAGNNILKVKGDFFTGGTTASANSYRILIYGRTGDDPEAAPLLIAGLNLVASTKVIQGLCYLNNAGTLNTYLINFAAGGLVVTPNTWIDMEIIFNQTTGRVSWVSEAAAIDGYYDGAASGFNIVEVDVAVIGGAGNTVSSLFKVDNFIVGAVATEDDVLSTPENLVVDKAFKVYPNPANSFFNIESSSAIENITLTDLNGRTVKNINVNSLSSTEVNISDLTAGMYFVTVQTDNGSGSTKIIKK